MKKITAGKGRRQKVKSQNNAYPQNIDKSYLSVNDKIYRHNTNVIKRTEKKIG